MSKFLGTFYLEMRLPADRFGWDDAEAIDDGYRQALMYVRRATRRAQERGLVLEQEYHTYKDLSVARWDNIYINVTGHFRQVFAMDSDRMNVYHAIKEHLPGAVTMTAIDPWEG